MLMNTASKGGCIWKQQHIYPNNSCVLLFLVVSIHLFTQLKCEVYSTLSAHFRFLLMQMGFHSQSCCHRTWPFSRTTQESFSQLPPTDHQNSSHKHPSLSRTEEEEEEHTQLCSVTLSKLTHSRGTPTTAEAVCQLNTLNVIKLFFLSISHRALMRGVLCIWKPKQTNLCSDNTAAD